MLWARSVEHLLKKGKITVWMILIGTFILGGTGTLNGKQGNSQIIIYPPPVLHIDLLIE
jgi:hypothetical protein